MTCRGETGDGKRDTGYALRHPSLQPLIRPLGVPRYWELAVDETGVPRSRVRAVGSRSACSTSPRTRSAPHRRDSVRARSAPGSWMRSARVRTECLRSPPGWVGRPATSMSRPLKRLVDMGIVRREVPFGESEKKSRRSIYRIDDAFFRLWFRVVAPNRGQLASGTTRTRLALLGRHWDQLVASTWEDLCRHSVPRLRRSNALGKLGPWGPASRWWRGNLPEWDVLAQAASGKRLLLAEVKWRSRPISRAAAAREAQAVASKPAPALPSKYAGYHTVRALFVPEVERGVPQLLGNVIIVTGDDILR